MDYTVHPAADIFPMLPDEKMKELADSIGKTGLLEPITADGTVFELVEITDDHAGTWIALFLVERQPDASWRIGGCSVAGGGVLRELDVVEMQPGQDSVNVAPKGDTPVLVLLTDGKANVARDGSPGRARPARWSHACLPMSRARWKWRRGDGWRPACA